MLLLSKDGLSQSIYYDAHVTGIMRTPHGADECTCVFLVRYVIDSFEVSASVFIIHSKATPTRYTIALTIRIYLTDITITGESGTPEIVLQAVARGGSTAIRWERGYPFFTQSLGPNPGQPVGIEIEKNMNLCQVGGLGVKSEILPSRTNLSWYLYCFLLYY